MPEIRFEIEWPDGSSEICYSPSLVIQDYFIPSHSYPLNDFVERSRTALTIASDRVQAKYGMPCGLALEQLQRIQEKATYYQQFPQPQVRIIRFI
jgi:uncharacterized repeat protein (TIGR04042 family)